MKNSAELPNHYFWLGIFGIITLVAISIPALIGIEPNKDGSMPIFCRVYAWILLGCFWVWGIYFTLINNERIIAKIKLPKPLSEILYAIILIAITFLFFNQTILDFISTYSLLAL